VVRLFDFTNLHEHVLPKTRCACVNAWEDIICCPLFLHLEYNICRSLDIKLDETDIAKLVVEYSSDELRHYSLSAKLKFHQARS
jgi:hypothetical protein